MDTKIVAYYLPQFHETQENNIWWEKGFTEWENVKKAKKLFDEHRQPRVPLDGYYDLSKKETLIKQAKLATKYGVNGFCFYHYWYSGTQLLQAPMDILLKNDDINIEFCLCWANHSWTRSWKNREGAHDVLIEQTYEKKYEDRKKHYEYLCKCFSDPRYIRIDQKPIFQIYQMGNIENQDQYINELREFCKKTINVDLHICSLETTWLHPLNRTHLKNADAITLFQPAAAMYGTENILNNKVKTLEIKNVINSVVRTIPLSLRKILYKAQEIFGEKYQAIPYKETWDKLIAQSIYMSKSDIKVYLGAFVDFDNTPRYKKRAKFFDGAKPSMFYKYFDRLLSINANEIVFVNAWNEWGEGAYLEPDTFNEYRYLEKISQAKRKIL